MRQHYAYSNASWYVTFWIFVTALAVWTLLFIAFGIREEHPQTGPARAPAAVADQGPNIAQAPADLREAEHPAEWGGVGHA